MFATGVGTSGVISGVKVFLKKDLLNGLADYEADGGQKEPGIFREPVNLKIERYNPDLPSLNARPTQEREMIQASRNSVDGTETQQEEEISFVEII
jgi:hypothetical protein